MRLLVSCGLVPGPQHETGGGNVLCALVQNLNNVAQKRVAWTTKEIPKHLWGRVVKEPDVFVLYPERIRGNPLRAPRVIRWLLMIPPKAILDSYDPQDILVGYCGIYETLAPIVAGYTVPRPVCTVCLICLPTLPATLLAQPKEPGLVVWTKRKRAAMVCDPHGLPPVASLVDSFVRRVEEIDYGTIFERALLMLRQASFFVCYDPFCFYALLAAMLDTDVVIYPIPGVTGQEYREHSPMMRFGVAYGLDELPRARATRGFTRDYLQTLAKNNIPQIEEFYSYLNKILPSS